MFMSLLEGGEQEVIEEEEIEPSKKKQKMVL
jgi:hypothetical protein